MMRKVVLAAGLVLLPHGAALADADFIKGVYLRTEEQCKKAKAESLDAVLEEGNSVLSSRGIESYEYNCEFVTVAKATRAPAWIVQAVCQEPGFLFPDVLTITEMNETQFDLVSVKPEDPEGGGGNGGSWYKCEGVTMP